MSEIITQAFITGKTYTLYADSDSTDYFYINLKNLVDQLLEKDVSELNLLNLIQYFSGKRYLLKQKLNCHNDKSRVAGILKLSHEYLGFYAEPVINHLNSLNFYSRFNKTISTTREQYYLYMVEIELTNRIFKKNFISSNIKMAFLPHCLHDLSKNCKATNDGVDYVCKACSKKCEINLLSRLLREYDIKPYIWRDANLRSLFKKLNENNKSAGVFGVACIVELVKGMRLCQKFNVPVVGIPLDANRCARWMGKFHDTTINLRTIEELIK